MGSAPTTDGVCGDVGAIERGRRRSCSWPAGGGYRTRRQLRGTTWSLKSTRFSI
jgi:hypothetical protein